MTDRFKGASVKASFEFPREFTPETVDLRGGGDVHPPVDLVHRFQPGDTTPTMAYC